MTKKKTIRSRVEDLEQKTDPMQVWINEKGVCTYTAPDGTKITMTEKEFHAKFPNARTIEYASDRVDRV